MPSGAAEDERCIPASNGSARDEAAAFWMARQLAEGAVAHVRFSL